MAKGLDIGTCFLVCSKTGLVGDTVETTKVRDAFVTIPSDRPGARNMLKLKRVSYLEDGDSIHVVGDDALRIANFLNMELRRPLSRGLISAKERDAEPILINLLSSILGNPEKGEVCYYSVPSAPIDDPGADIVYHEMMFKKIIESLGFKAMPMNEAVSIIYSNCLDDDFSGIGVSFGAGMVNVAVVYNTMPGLAFSIAKSGDWIDEQSARAVGRTAAQMMSIKESGVDLMDYKAGLPEYIREREAIVLYYKNLIHNTLKEIRNRLRDVSSSVSIDRPIPLILSGGTTGPINFLELFKEEFDNLGGLPIKVSEIRMAADPLNDVANGLLVAAQAED